jgi:syntaxin 8
MLKLINFLQFPCALFGLKKEDCKNSTLISSLVDIQVLLVFILDYQTKKFNLKMSLINVDSFSMEFDAVEKLTREIQSQLNQRNPQNYYSLSGSLRIRIKQLGSEIAQISRNLRDLGSSRAITKDEEERRLRQIEQLQTKLVQIETQFLKKPGEEERKELLAGSSSKGLWEGDDDEILNTNVPIEHMRNEQTLIIQSQDDQLEQLANTISRQKHIAIKLSDEVETHNEILDDLGTTMENVNSRVTNETQHVERVSRRDNTCSYWVIIISLFVAIVIVGIL